MSDIADIAQNVMDFEQELRSKYRQPLTKEFEPSGYCLNCEEILSEQQRWCDEYCREDHNTRIKQRQRE